jgi:hypothetical protein
MFVDVCSFHEPSLPVPRHHHHHQVEEALEDQHHMEF